MTDTTRRLRRVDVARAALLAGAVTAAALTLVGPAVADDGGDDLVPGTPCTTSARACADLATNQAWLIHDGEVTRGPVAASHGGQGQETPRGTFEVQWRDEHHRSAEFDDAPMNYSVFFADGGIAFHEGSPERQSAGCVHLSRDDAAAWYADLQVGDEVQIR